MRTHKVSSVTNARSGGETESPTRPQRHLDRIRRTIRYVGGKVRTSFALVGMASAAAVYFECQAMFQAKDDDSAQKKKVLVIPFNRISLNDKQDGDFIDVGSLSQLNTVSEDQPLNTTARELVDIIHHAASDPNIVALYGEFGHGSLLSSAGWADLEEVRNALKVFREAHRVHKEPNLSHEMHQVIKRNENKPLYAYADTLSSMSDPGNKEYYLASIFTHIHMQERGELNLFGMVYEQLFLRDMLKKYGIVLNVFKHGQYKNATYIFTESGFNRAHRENAANILESVNANVYEEISAVRSKSWLKKRSGEELWKRIQQSGTFPALTAWKAGLVDFVPRRDPLPELVMSNMKDDLKDVFNLQWKAKELDLDRFKADEVVTVDVYAKQMQQEKQAAEKRQVWWSRLDQYPKVKSALLTVGLVEESKAKQHIALLHIEGSIDDAMARKTVSTIRKLRFDKNTKCVVVRVSSPGGSLDPCEAISAELKALDVPVVFSLGNEATSGGYYVSATADRIFASHKTVTGSIGVYGIRADLTGLAARYGIKAEHLTSGDLSGTMVALHPMSRKMKRTFAESIDRFYEQFKGVVAEGRGMSIDDVERIAQGRLWTGEQAKRNGLVDELGGLYRAIAYAQRQYCEDDADVVEWPPKLTFWDIVWGAISSGNVTAMVQTLGATAPAANHTLGPKVVTESSLVSKLLKGGPTVLPGTLSGVYLAADENTALRCLVDGVGEGKSDDDDFPISSFWR